MPILAKIRRTTVKKHNKQSLIKEEEDRRYYDIQTHTLKLDNLIGFQNLKSDLLYLLWFSSY